MNPAILCTLRGGILLAVCLTARTSWAQPAEAPEPVKVGREALDRYADYPWYDAERDTVRRIDVEPPRDLTGRASRWETKPVNWSFPDWVGTFFDGLLWALGILALLAIVYALYRALQNVDLVGGSEAAIDEDALHGDIDRVEALPFALARPQSDLLSEARRYYDAGDFHHAMIYLYSYQLVELDRRHLIRLTKGKTNRQYLRELRTQPELQQVLRGSMIAFEDVFFGKHVLSRLRFEQHWHELDRFHEHLEQLAVA